MPSCVRFDVPLAPRTTLGVGGPARTFASVASPDELADVLRWAAAAGIPVLPLGCGSNVLVADEGYPGLVVVQERGAWREDPSRPGRLHVDGGVEWDTLVAHTVAQGWAGLECLSGIPGLCGAAPMQNIGAYGQEVAGVVVAVRAVERATAAVRTFGREECRFAYRQSIFKGGEADRWIITELELQLQVGGAAQVVYRDLRERLSPGASLDDVRNTVLAVRAEKSMVLRADDPNRRSAGSFFLNPELSPEQLATLRGRLSAVGIAPEELPTHAAPGGRTKVPAAWLIERSGFPKGFTLGPAGLSTRHTLALINRGGATARDLVALAAHIRRGVRNHLGVHLHPEPVFVGFAEPPAQLLDEAA